LEESAAKIEAANVEDDEELEIAKVPEESNKIEENIAFVEEQSKTEVIQSA